MNAKEMIMKPSIIAKTLTIAAIAALALGIAPIANAGEACSNPSLQGSFVFKGVGFIVSPATVAGPFADVNTLTFDGNGAATGTGIVSQNGNIVPVAETGTYKVNPDCTGTYEVLLSPFGFTAHYYFVIDAKEARSIAEKLQTESLRAQRLAISISGMGEAYRKLGDVQRSCAAYAESLKLYHEVLKSSPVYADAAEATEKAYSRCPDANR